MEPKSDWAPDAFSHRSVLIGLCTFMRKWWEMFSPDTGGSEEEGESDQVAFRESH